MKHLKPMEDELKMVLTSAMIAAVVRLPNGMEVIRSALKAVEKVHAEMDEDLPIGRRVIPLRPFFLFNAERET